jgi:hypothetical protein
MTVPLPREVPAADLPIASLRRRTAALLIDAILTGAGLIATDASVNYVYRRGGRPEDGRTGRGGADDQSFVIWLGARLPSPPALIPLRVGLRGFRGPGAWMLRLRRVELATGRPVGANTAIVRELTGSLTVATVDALVTPLALRYSPPRVRSTRRVADSGHGANERPLDEPVPDVSEISARKFFVGAGIRGIAQAASMVLPTILSPLNQTIADRTVGTVVIIEPRQP